MKTSVKRKRTSGEGEGAITDDRFKHLQSDPKFSGLSNKTKKIVIEKRFAAALTDAKFSSRAPVDKRGRVMKKTTGNDLLDLYEVEQSDDDEKEEKVEAKKAKVEESDDDEEEASDDDAPLKMDLARGEGNFSSSDESDSDESDWEMDDKMHMDMDLAQLDQEAERVEWASRRLAVCNLDWNLVKCEDIMILVNSFKPAGGRVERISIYLSDFGKERLEEEEKHGPRLQLSKPLEDYQEDEMDPETRVAIRKYQMDLLKYYYAVIECDEEQTATAIYEQCDGFQFESSGLKMDLRFVPDDMEFEEDRLKERVTEGDINVDKYRSKENVKSGVTFTDGRLDWDENDDSRAKMFQDAFKEDGGAGGLIAESDSEDDETVSNRRKALLSLIQGGNDDDLQVDWEEKEVPAVAKKEEDSDDSDIEKALARRDAGDASESEEEEEEVPAEEEKRDKKKNFKSYLEKRKAKRRERKEKVKEARKAQTDELNEVGKEAKKRQKEERKRQQAVAGNEDVVEEVAADDRFKALFTDSAFAIEQSAKEFKGSKLIEKQAAVKKETTAAPKTSADDLVSKLKQKTNKWEQKKRK